MTQSTGSRANTNFKAEVDYACLLVELAEKTGATLAVTARDSTTNEYAIIFNKGTDTQRDPTSVSLLPFGSSMITVTINPHVIKARCYDEPKTRHTHQAGDNTPQLLSLSPAAISIDEFMKVKANLAQVIIENISDLGAIKSAQEMLQEEYQPPRPDLLFKVQAALTPPTAG